MKHNLLSFSIFAFVLGSAAEEFQFSVPPKMKYERIESPAESYIFSLSPSVNGVSRITDGPYLKIERISKKDFDAAMAKDYHTRRSEFIEWIRFSFDPPPADFERLWIDEFENTYPGVNGYWFTGSLDLEAEKGLHVMSGFVSVGKVYWHIKVPPRPIAKNLGRAFRVVQLLPESMDQNKTGYTTRD